MLEIQLMYEHELETLVTIEHEWDYELPDLHGDSTTYVLNTPVCAPMK